jgi:hypothetical protein
MAVLVEDVRSLFKKYNLFLRDLQEIDNSLSDKVVPYFEQEYKITQLQRLTCELNDIARGIKENGYIPSDDELRRGFKCVIT